MTDPTPLISLGAAACCCLAVFLLALVVFSVAFRPRRPRSRELAGMAPPPRRGVQTRASLTRMEMEPEPPAPTPTPAAAPSPPPSPVSAPSPPPSPAPDQRFGGASAEVTLPSRTNDATVRSPPPIPPGTRFLTPSVTIAPGSGEDEPPAPPPNGPQSDGPPKKE